jgi:predicted nucleotidyltransferase
MRHNLDKILSQGSKIKILRFLYLQKGEHTGRAIARGIGMSPSVVLGTLRELNEEGLLSLKKAGKAHLYGIDEENHLVKKLLGPLFEGEKNLIVDIISAIKRGISKRKEDIVSMALFGSVIRAEEKPGSDIDLLVVTHTSQGKSRIQKLLERVDSSIMKQFKTTLSPYIKTQSDFKMAYRDKKPVILSILKNHRLIFGEPLERILA